MSDPRDDMEQHLVDVGGYRLALNIAGTGSPTVVLEAGAGCGSDVWREVQRGVAQFTRVVSYDRAGIGTSEAAPTPRTGQEMVKDLHALLLAAQILGPYVLVGHSLGGLLVRLYAHHWPADVVGLVLVDAPHPDYPERALALLPPPTPGECSEITESRHFFRQGIYDPHTHPEHLNLGECCAAVKATDPLGDRPLVVLSAMREEPFPDDFPSDLARQIRRLGLELQRDLTRLSTHSRQILVEESGHFIQADQPAVVVDTVRQMAEAARNAASRHASMG